MDPTNTTLYGSEDYGNSTVLEIQYRYEGSDVLSIINADEQCPSFCQPIFDKFELFKREITTLSNCDNTKQILNRSISLWNELLQMVKNATSHDIYYLDESLNLVTKLFLDAKETKLFNDDTNFSRNLFFNYLNLINTHEFQQFLILPSSSTLIDIIFESNMDTALLLMIHLSNFVLFVDSDLADQYNSLLNAIRIHIDQKIQSTILGKQIEKNRSTLHERTLLFLWHLSDHTVVIPSLLRAGYGKCVIEWLNCPTLPDDIRRPIVSIVHNIARHDEGADELNRYRAIDTINQMQQLDTVHKSEMLLLNTMALALLSTPNQIKEDPTGTKCILDQLLQITVNASIAERFRYNGFHVSEPLAVLVKLFVDDATFDYVMNQGQTNVLPNSTTTMKLFSDLLVTFYGMLQKKIRLEQFTFIALINILWSVSFHEIYHEELKEHEGLISIIRNIAISDSQLIIEQYVPRSMQSVKKAADGILFNLRLETSVVPTSFPLLTIAQQKPLVMISYSHANSDFCNKILELLDQKADQFDVWIDQRCCKTSGDVWESIAKGIKSADLIICVISEEYMASKACRQEVIYAKDRLNKRFLPVFVGRPEMSEWLDIRLAQFKYIRFENMNLKLDQNKADEFLSMVIESMSLENQSKLNPTNESSSASSGSDTSSNTTETKRPSSPLTTAPHCESINTTNKSVLTWTQNDIHKWFNQNNISLEIRDMYQFQTGAQMATYAECLQDGWQRQYEKYAVRYAQLYPDKELFEHEFALFVSTLRQLLQ